MNEPDFWSKHNIGTRLVLVAFVISYIAVVIASFLGITVPVVIVNMVWYSTLIGFMTVTLGANGVDKLLSNIAKIKLGKYQIENTSIKKV